MLCPNCKTALDPGIRKCPHCGFDISPSESSPQINSTPAQTQEESLTNKEKIIASILPYWRKFRSSENFKLQIGVGLGIVVLVIVSSILLLKYKNPFNTQKQSDSSQSSIESSRRKTVNAYGSAPKAGEDFEKGVILFALKGEQIPITSQEVDINNIKEIPQSLQSIFKKYNATKISRPFFDQPVLQEVYLVKVSEDQEILALMTDLQKDSNVKFAEPNYFVKQNAIPSDPYFSSKGAWGQSYDDLWNLKLIDMPRAWDLSKGDGVTVEVLDDGVDPLNPDLEGQVINVNSPGACMGTHGTHIAGIIAAKEDGKGVIGVAPHAKIYPDSAFTPCKKFPPEEKLKFDNSAHDVLPKGPITRAIVSPIAGSIGTVAYIPRVLSANADIINFSSGIPVGASSVFNSAIDYSVLSNNTTFVTSAGNESLNVAGMAPANNPRAIVVSAVDQNDSFASYSNYGATVTVSAPGGDVSFNILSTGSTQYDLSTYLWKGSPANVGDYLVRMTGTSMAAPHVAGLAALVKSLHPDWNNNKIKCAIILGAEDKGDPGWDPKYGYGRINAYKTLSLDPNLVTEDCIPIAQIKTPEDNSGVNTGSGSLDIGGTAYAKDIAYFKLESLSEGADFQTGWQTIKEVQGQIVQDGSLGTWSDTGLPEGNYEIRLTVEDKKGNKAVDEAPVYLFGDQKQTRQSSNPWDNRCPQYNGPVGAGNYNYDLSQKSSLGISCSSDSDCSCDYRCIQGACSNGNINMKCATSDDCDGKYGTMFCTNGFCTNGTNAAVCNTSADCRHISKEDDYQCISNSCVFNYKQSDTFGKSCSSDNQCGTGNKCINNQCTHGRYYSSCNTNSDCESGICFSNRCFIENAAGTGGPNTICRSNLDCDSLNSYQCTNNICGYCTQNSDCSFGRKCINNTCMAN